LKLGRGRDKKTINGLLLVIAPESDLDFEDPILD
jgi:hypothetical protein